MSTPADKIDLPQSENKINLESKLEDYGKLQKVIAQTSRLELRTPTLLDMLLHSYESSTVSELTKNLQKEHGSNVDQEIENTLRWYRDPKDMQWLLFLPITPFGQVSFFLKDGQYIGHCRFYFPEGEKVDYKRGGDSGTPQGLSPGFAEMSIHLLDKFTDKGYGPEGLGKAVETIIKPVIETHPLVYAGEDSENQPVFRPSVHRFLGLTTVTGFVNIFSLRAQMKAGFVPGKLVDHYPSPRYSGYMDLRYPNPTDETEKLGKFLQEWIEGCKPLGREYLDKPYFTSEDGLCNYGFKPEIFLLYHKLIRQYSYTLGNPHSDSALISYEKSLNNNYLTDINRSTIEDALTILPRESVALVWQYVGQSQLIPINLTDKIRELPPMSEENQPKMKPL